MRRSSSKQGLQNLLRVTAQRSIEDAEEIERERRRRAREAFRNQQSLSGSAGSLQDSVNPPETGLYESEFKPSIPTAVDEDEGFSDWTQKLERRTRSRMAENGSGEQLQQEEKDGNERSRQSDRSSFTTSTQRQQIQDREDEEKRPERRRSAERRTEISPRSEEWHDDSKRRLQEIKPLMENKMKEERKEVKVSYTSQVFLQKDRVPNGNGEAAAEEMTSHLVKTKRSPSRTVDVDQIFETKKDVHAGLETELKLEKIRRSHQEKESKEMEQLRQRQAEAELELEELKKKREERRKAREEEERKKEEEEQQKLTKKEEEKRQMKEDIERRRIEAAEKRMKNATDGDDPFNPLNPMSPTFKITARTESLNQSLKKSNSFKKTQRPVLLPKIDDKLEQYTNAIEISSKDAKLTKSATVDMPSVSAPVASKKNLFEAGEVRSQSSPKGTPLKDTECVKVGVANLINHWVKGSPEGGNRQSPSTPSDVKPGDVLQKKNMWEIIGEGSAGERSGLGGKGSSSGKRYKFVVTGHGKYEKISTDGDHYSVYPNGKTSEFSSDRL
ncbi:non-muscle caldesmon-like isoform X1 [Carassius gibelio]|uniref:non-muscle caldesmon-like isoform X1 n=2 Tax=Carassius gibelio TaxID=101364 RepID=UPI0022798351|nr:non-muscle caldesmon-like isoform X1 [Carassius gibelio]XP_052453332.1 non-muscle caldesmon-like isoform X1 [Carassius gibelio]